MKTCPRCGKEYPNTNTLCPSDGTALETTVDPLIGETLAGKYRVEERLSVGGMGTVYRGTHILMDKKVAIKVLRPSLAADETIVARFSREARAASRISHPHALSVTDFGEAESGVVFLVMEFLSGRTLKEVIRQESPLPLQRVVEIIKQVGGALETAHAEGVIHRDLKSDNIMLLNTSADYAKVLDFGIAKIQEPIGSHDPGLTSPDLVVGTPQYMSPEQCSQLSEIDARSDIYSLGVILFEMLVGHVPFRGESATAIMLKQLQELPPSVLDERRDLPASVGLVVSRALAKRPEDRYQKIGELIEDLVIAAGSGLLLSGVADRGPSRIVVPTHAGLTINDIARESEDTLVRVRVGTAAGVASATAGAAASAASFNPWRIVIPSFAGLLVVMAVIYAFTRNSEPTANTNQQTGASTLSADPNSQPVQPSAPPTGQNEAGIPSGGAINSNAQANVNTASPTPVEDLNANSNTNATNDNKAPANANSNRSSETASPTPSPRPANSNQTPAASPSPQPSPKPTLPPPITPAPPPRSR